MLHFWNIYIYLDILESILTKPPLIKFVSVYVVNKSNQYVTMFFFILQYKSKVRKTNL